MIADVPLPPAAIFGLPEWAGRLALVGVILVVAILLLSAISWAVPRLIARTAKGPRSRERQTAVSALATTLRYIVLGGALVATAFALVGAAGLGAVSGGALVVLVATFASQRLLVDVVAGFFILFEDQYGVGDTIRLEPSGYTGEVRALGLRATVLAGPGGERMVVPNGQINAVRIFPSGRRRHRIELLTQEPDLVSAAVTELVGATRRTGGPWRSDARVVRQDESGRPSRLIVIVDVDAHREDAVDWLCDAVVARVGEHLAAPPLRGLDLGGR